MGILKTLSKRRSVFFIVLILAILVIISGIFLFKEEHRDYEEIIKKTELVGGYEVIESEVGHTIINKDCGLSVSVPSGWTIRNNGKEGIGIFSPEIRLNEKESFLESAKETGGCLMGIEIKRAVKVDPDLETDAESLIIFIDKLENNPNISDDKNIKYEAIKINKKKALKTMYFKDGKEIYTEIEIPINDLIYEFNNGLIYSNECIEKFNEILKTVEINR